MDKEVKKDIIKTSALLVAWFASITLGAITYYLLNPFN